MHETRNRSEIPWFTLPLLAGGALLLFLAAPWSLEEKTRAALHGLCAQRPSHSFTLGGQTLPFDARMTGMYGGFAATALYLAGRRRFRRAGVPGRWTLGILGLFVGAMAVDGFNSLLVDVQTWHAYAPRNDLRFITGLLTGIALAVALCYLLAATLWKRPDWRRGPVEGIREVVLLAGLQVPFFVAVTSGPGFLYAPVALSLLVSAAVVIGALTLVLVLLALRRDGAFESLSQVQGPAAAAFVLGCLVMAAFASGRFLLEAWTGAPPLT
jgi:uncharacterized membrane protein